MLYTPTTSYASLTDSAFPPLDPGRVVRAIYIDISTLTKPDHPLTLLAILSSKATLFLFFELQPTSPADCRTRSCTPSTAFVCSRSQRRSGARTAHERRNVLVHLNERNLLPDACSWVIAQDTFAATHAHAARDVVGEPGFGEPLGIYSLEYMSFVNLANLACIPGQAKPTSTSTFETISVWRRRPNKLLSSTRLQAGRDKNHSGSLHLARLLLARDTRLAQLISRHCCTHTAAVNICACRHTHASIWQFSVAFDKVSRPRCKVLFDPQNCRCGGEQAPPGSPESSKPLEWFQRHQLQRHQLLLCFLVTIN